MSERGRESSGGREGGRERGTCQPLAAPAAHGGCGCAQPSWPRLLVCLRFHLLHTRTHTGREGWQAAGQPQRSLRRLPYALHSQPSTWPSPFGRTTRPCSPDQQYAASKKLLALAGVKLRQHRFRHPVTLRLTNHPAFPVVRHVDSAAVAAEATAAAAAAATAAHAAASAGPARLGPGADGTSPAKQQQQPQQPANGSHSHAQGEAAAMAAGSAAAAAAAAAAAVLGGLGFCPAGGAAGAGGGSAAPPLLAALAQQRWQATGSAADFAAAVNGGGSSVQSVLPSVSGQPQPASSTASSPVRAPLPANGRGPWEQEGAASAAAADSGGAGNVEAAAEALAAAKLVDGVESSGSEEGSEDAAGEASVGGSGVWEAAMGEQVGLA